MHDSRKAELIGYTRLRVRDRENPYRFCDDPSKQNKPQRSRQKRWKNKIARAREKRIIEAEIADVNLDPDEDEDDCGFDWQSLWELDPILEDANRIREDDEEEDD